MDCLSLTSLCIAKCAAIVAMVDLEETSEFLSNFQECLSLLPATISSEIICLMKKSNTLTHKHFAFLLHPETKAMDLSVTEECTWDEELMLKTMESVANTIEEVNMGNIMLLCLNLFSPSLSFFFF